MPEVPDPPQFLKGVDSAEVLLSNYIGDYFQSSSLQSKNAENGRQVGMVLFSAACFNAQCRWPPHTHWLPLYWHLYEILGLGGGQSLWCPSWSLQDWRKSGYSKIWTLVSGLWEGVSLQGAGRGRNILIWGQPVVLKSGEWTVAW